MRLALGMRARSLSLGWLLSRARGRESPFGVLCGKPICVEPDDHNPIADADETPADLVLISPKFEGPGRQLQSAQHQCALSSKGVDDQ
jgi:hypothetical protein